jgi:uncharacterized membrane protein YcaP (DUF421 family)
MVIAAVRAALIYVVLVAALRVMGKRQLGDLQPSELVVTLLIADMAAVAMQDTASPLFSGLIPIAVLVSLELLISAAMLKLPFLERLLGGRAVVLIQNGKLDQQAMRKLRLTIDDVLSALRQQGVFDLRQVQYAVAETGGQISLLLKPAERPLTPKEANLPAAPDDTPFLVVSDGKLAPCGLALCGKNEQWVHRTLRARQCALDDVFLMIADRQGNVHLIKKETSS